MSPEDFPATTTELARPVRAIPSDPPKDEPGPGIALCLSGGGYRAMLFHAGALWRLNEAGVLRSLDRISSVSGGSITAGALAQAWGELEIDSGGVATDFSAKVVGPVRRLANHTVDQWAVVRGALTPETVSARVAAAYSEHLFQDRTLQDLPDMPRFIFNATNLGSGALWRFSKPYMGDWRIGRIAQPELPLADAVAASAAFPPVLSPYRLDLRGAKWMTEKKPPPLTMDKFRDEAILVDGGVYDNLGLETAWKRFQTILVSDAGGRLADDDEPDTDWARQTLRVLKVIDNQVRSLRKRQIHTSLKLDLRSGAYWGIRDPIEHHRDALAFSAQASRELADIPTRLKRLDPNTQERLINWGYAACDAGLREWRKGLPGPAGFPYSAAA